MFSGDIAAAFGEGDGGYLVLFGAYRKTWRVLIPHDQHRNRCT